MYGPEDEKDSDNIEKMGVIPQSCAYIFNILNNKDHPLVEGMLSYEVQCEFVEIYNEQLKDLLDLNNKPEIKQICVNAHRDEWKVIVRNVQRRRVKDMMEVLTAIRFASKNRTVAGTNLNATSSRSHMVMRLIVKIETADGVRTGIGNFSDLAGSEKVKKTGAKGKRLQEAKSILLSLTTLSRVIEALVKNKLPPFQESKLTFMLKDSLGGNCKTALLIAASPHVVSIYLYICLCVLHVLYTYDMLFFSVVCISIISYSLTEMRPFEVCNLVNDVERFRIKQKSMLYKQRHN